jgi:hypothetical protein
MISMDWKLRLQQDVEDFLTRRASSGDFDLDIIYNAYPKRVEGKIPKEVVVFVAKALAGKIAKQPDQYKTLFDYFWNKKGENGRLALAYIFGRIVRRKPVPYLEQYFMDYLVKSTDSAEINLLLDKTVFPLFKEDPNHYLETLIRWLKVDNLTMKKCLINLLVKSAATQTELGRMAFRRLESSWLYATPESVKLFSTFLRALAKTDNEFYESVYEHYKQTRNPVFVEILAGAVVGPSPQIEAALENWAHSGNARLKKAALAAQRIVQRRKG